MKTFIPPLALFVASLFWFVPSAADVRAPENPNSAKECALCHYRWVDTFFIEGKGSDLVDYQSEKVEARPEMCFSCHDGSVIDSRARVHNDFRHKVDVPPPPHMKIPQIFPLDDKGRMQCSTCHTAHSMPSGTGNDESIFLRTSNRGSSICRRCHPEMDGGIAAGHHPTGDVQKNIPASLLPRHADEQGVQRTISCETCHTTHGSPYESLLRKNGRDCGLCLTCHGDKDSLALEGTKRPFHGINVRPAHLKVPDELIKQGAFVGDQGAVICLTCHKVHANKAERHLLLVKQDKKSTLCLTCHADKEYLLQTKHNLGQSAPAEKNLQGETVADGGPCSACHLPHKAARKLNEKAGLTSQLCLSCHGPGRFAENKSLGGYTHPLNISPLVVASSDNPLRTVSIGSTGLTLPLFDRSGAQSESGLITCVTCHDPHREQQASVSTGAGAGEKKGNQSLLLRKKSPELCGECHSNKMCIASSKHDLTAHGVKVKGSSSRKSPPEDLCKSCHLVHNPQKKSSWARETTLKHEPDVQHLCLDCHNEQGLAKDKVIKGYSHPVNVSPSKSGIAAALPLFDKNGNVSQQGVVECTTCHNPHRWDPLGAVCENAAVLEGNAQNSFLRLAAAPSPKLCGSCHPGQAYIENTDHDLRITAPASKNALGQMPAESGACGACHLVHNSESAIRLWGQRLAQGDNVMETMCTACHCAHGTAASKVPLISLHPDSKVVNIDRISNGRANYLPLFDRQTGERTDVENISCPSCHNAHQWDPQVPSAGKGKNVEGDATTSFLRATSSVRLCKDCHGLDALFRYKFYHEPGKRTSKGGGMPPS